MSKSSFNFAIAIGILIGIFGLAPLCIAAFNSQYEKRCPEEGAAADLPFKIVKINNWSECYLKCPTSWVPANGFQGCPR